MIALKAIVSAGVILAINLVARRNPALGGWIAALPTITLLSILWLVVDGSDNTRIAGFVTGVMWGLIPNALCLSVLVLLTRHGLPLLVAVACGLSIWLVYTLVAQRFSLFGF